MKRHVRPALLLLIALTAADAQTNAPVIPPRPTPVPGTTARPIPTLVPAPALNNASAAATVDPNAMEPGIQLMNMPVVQVLEHYERITGKRIIREANLADIKITFNAKGPLPRAEAVRLLETVLILNGITFVPIDDNAVKVMGVKNPKSEGVQLYTDPKDLPAGDQVSSFFMPLRHITPEAAIAILTQQITGHSYTQYIPVPGAQAIVITENAANIRRLIQLRELIDVAPAKVVTEFVPLERADAEQVAQTIIEIIQKKETGTTPTPTPVRAPNQPGLPGAQGAQTIQGGDTGGGGPNENSLVAGDVKIIPDKRTNRILVITRPANLEFIKNLIKQFDSVVTLSSQLERALRYVSATEVLPVLQELITENSDAAGATGGALPGARPGGTATGGSNLRGGSQRTGSNRSGTGSTIGGGGGGGLSTASQLEDGEDSPPVSVSVGKVRLIANPKANSIIVIGPPDARQKVSDLLEKLDQKPRQVYLASVIGQMSLGKGTEFGIDLVQRAKGNGNNTLSAGLRNTAINLIDPSQLLTGSNLVALASGLTVYGKADDLSVYVKALEDSNRFRVLSRPAVYATNNKKASILSGRQVPVPTSTVSEIGSGNNNNTFQSNIQFRDVVLKLEVLPLINAFNEVTLQIVQDNDSIVGSTQVSGNSVPVIGTQSIDTTVTVPNRGIVVIGGLITESLTADASGLPYLQNIPLIGSLFKVQTKRKDRNELIIMIQPTVVDAPENVAGPSHEESTRALVSPSAINMARPPSDFAKIPRGEVVGPVKGR